MGAVIEILTRVPQGLPRVAVIVLVAAMVALPKVRNFLFGQKIEQNQLARARDLLQVRKLQLEVDGLKRSQPEDVVGDDGLDQRVQALLAKDKQEQVPPQPLNLSERLRAASLGGLAFFVVEIILVVAGGLREFETFTALLLFLLADLAVVVACAALAGVFPGTSRRGLVIRGFGLPLLLGCLLALVK